MVVAMAPTKRIRITDLNASLMCSLCKGYLIDATTITECLHSFCRSCLVKYLSMNKYCPVCDVQVHKTKPLINIRSDKTLQDFVYKLVPGLYQNEMLRRCTFYQTIEDVNKPNDPERMGVINKYSKFISADEKLSISLEFMNGSAKIKSTVKESSNLKLSQLQFEPQKSFLSCPAIVVIRLLKKWLLTKFALDSSRFQVEMFYDQHLLYDDLTLMDVAYLYVWQGNTPMNLSFKIYEKIKKVIIKELDDEPPTLAQQPPVTKRVKFADNNHSPTLASLDDPESLTIKEEEDGDDRKENDSIKQQSSKINATEQPPVVTMTPKTTSAQTVKDTVSTSKKTETTMTTVTQSITPLNPSKSLIPLVIPPPVITKPVTMTSSTISDMPKLENLSRIPGLIDIKHRKRSKEDIPALVPTNSQPPPLLPTSLSTPSKVTVTTNNSRPEVPSLDEGKIKLCEKITSPTTIPVLSIPSPPAIMTTSPIKITPKVMTSKHPIKPRDELIIVPISSSNAPVSNTPIVTSNAVSVSSSKPTSPAPPGLTISAKAVSTSATTTTTSTTPIRHHRLPQSLHNQHLIGMKRPMPSLTKHDEKSVPPYKNSKLSSSVGQMTSASMIPVYNSVKNPPKSTNIRNHTSTYSISSLTTTTSSSTSTTSSSSTSRSTPKVGPKQNPQTCYNSSSRSLAMDPGYEIQRFCEMYRKLPIYYDGSKTHLQALPITVKSINQSTSIPKTLSTSQIKPDQKLHTPMASSSSSSTTSTSSNLTVTVSSSSSSTSSTNKAITSTILTITSVTTTSSTQAIKTTSSSIMSMPTLTSTNAVVSQTLKATTADLRLMPKSKTDEITSSDKKSITSATNGVSTPTANTESDAEVLTITTSNQTPTTTN